MYLSMQCNPLYKFHNPHTKIVNFDLKLTWTQWSAAIWSKSAKFAGDLKYPSELALRNPKRKQYNLKFPITRVQNNFSPLI